MFIVKKTKLQIEQDKVENLLKGFKSVIIGDVAKCLRGVLGTQAIMRVETSPEIIEKMTGAQYSVSNGKRFVWVDGVALSDTDFIGFFLDRETVAKSAYIYAGGNSSMVSENSFDLKTQLSIFEESFVLHLSEQLLPFFDIAVLGDTSLGNDGGFPSRLNSTELSLDGVNDIYIDEVVFLVNGDEIHVGIVATKSVLDKMGELGKTDSGSIETVVKKKVTVDVGAYFSCEQLLLDDVLSLEVGTCIPLIEKPTGGVKASLKSGGVSLSSNGIIGTNSVDQIIFKCS